MYLQSFEDARRAISPHKRVEKVPIGIRRVPIPRISGSVSRSRDFDDRFLPLNNGLRNRWEGIYREFQRLEALGDSIQPVSLYMIGDQYFVKDGNHRVSVARFRGSREIEADVTLLRLLRENQETSDLNA
jgi:hypothetical protein